MNTDSVFLFIMVMFGIAVGLGLLGLIVLAYMVWRGA